MGTWGHQLIYGKDACGGRSMLIAGTIICGGGPVVIPLLRGYTVDPGWVSGREFERCSELYDSRYSCMVPALTHR
jgi:hypothetical protein